MTYYTKTEYWGNLFHNAESLVKTTNPYFKNTRVPPNLEIEAESVTVKHIFQYTSVSLC